MEIYRSARADARGQAAGRVRPGQSRKGGIPTILTGIDADVIAVVNGRYEPAWSDFNGKDPGVTVDELFKFLGENPDYRLGQVPGSDDTALSLNTAFMSGGLALRVKRGTHVAKPIHIAHVFTGDAAAAMYPRVVVIVDPGARVTLIEII